MNDSKEMVRKIRCKVIFSILLMLSAFARCKPEKVRPETVVIVLAAHTGVQGIFHREIIPTFQDYWLRKTEQKVKFRESYHGSVVQVQAVLAGLEADIVILASEDHLKVLEKVGLITHSWRAHPHRGIIARSVIAFGLREGNPKDLFTWEELAQQGVEIIHADPNTSGVALWAIGSIYGAGLKLSEVTPGQKDQLQARQFFNEVEKRVRIMDQTTQAASHTFNRGQGDVLITAEHEIKLQQQSGKPMEMIIPTPTLLIEYPVALIDKHVTDHDNREVVEAFLKFLWSREIQDIFAEYGFRPVDNWALEKHIASFTKPRELFDLQYAGGWEEIRKLAGGP
ncbi:MAG: sulfate ABC transporter substrate-binding protein [bacterium]